MCEHVPIHTSPPNPGELILNSYTLFQVYIKICYGTKGTSIHTVNPVSKKRRPYTTKLQS